MARAPEHSRAAAAAGANIAAFTARQLEFAAHIRNPDLHPAPNDVDPRRMRVYVDLFFNNLESLLSSAFPVTKAVLGEVRWRELVRVFLQRHPCGTPYFLEISEEFILFINDLKDFYVPEFIAQLVHYEWVELGLNVAEDPLLPDDLDPRGDLLAGVVIRSPLAWSVDYAYPVHLIGPGFQPDAPGATPSHLVVYRDADLRVRFMEVNALTQRLLALLDGAVTGRQALTRLADELDAGGYARIETGGAEILERLRAAGILLGSRRIA